MSVLKSGKNPVLKIKKYEINLIKFNDKSKKEKKEKLKNILNDIYDNSFIISDKYINKIINLTNRKKNNFIFLPFNLKISKENETLKFEFISKKSVGFIWVMFSVLLFLLITTASIYAGYNYFKYANLNKDIDGDGIADINIDIDGDGIADINIDLDGDNIPDLNIDYKGNRKAVFNIDTTGDGKADSNLVNDATDGKPCNINCDINGDGWPDINLDLDGDGIADVDIDTTGDGIADLNLDVDGDGICDINCDTTGDSICDEKCVDVNKIDSEISTGTSLITGISSVETSTPYLTINYKQGATIDVKRLLPDDQPIIPGVSFEKPVKEFVVENMSDYPIVYSLRWNVSINTFTTNNLIYTMQSSNGGPSLSKAEIPKKSEIITKDILIMPRVKQKFKIEISLKGVGKPQNEDQGKVFTGHVELVLN